MITNADRDDTLEGVEEGKTVSQDHEPSVTAVTSGKTHAPGPWKADFVEGCWLVFDAGGESVAQVAWGDYSPNERADAKLISAAPELLEAVKRAIRHAINIGIDEEGSSYFRQLKEAEAKAEGRAPSSAEQVSGQVPGTNTEPQLSTGEQP